AVTNDAVPRNPVIEVTVAGQSTWMLLDTGANGHVLDPELAKKSGLNARGSGVGRDHFGQAMITSDLSDVELRTSGWTTRSDFVTHSRPESLRRRGILGTLSPQHLLESGVVVMDLPGKRLVLLERPPEDIRGWLATVLPNWDFVELRRDQSSSEFLIPAALGRKPATLVLLDTGSGETEFSPKYTGLEPGVYGSSEVLHIGGRALVLNRVEVSPYLDRESMAGILGLDSIGDMVLVFPPGHSKLLLGARK
ncbi:MAG: retropepsin-like aspartic protease, partial [Pseudomonadota bacterium]